MKLLKRILFILLFVIVILFIGIYSYFKGDTQIPYKKPDPLPVEVPSFNEVKIDFNHSFNSKIHLPIMGSAIIDVDNDNVPELFLGGGHNQPDGLFKYVDSIFINIASEWNLDLNKQMQSYGTSVYDFDQDGDQDLLVAREDDIYYYRNEGNRFIEKALNLPFDENSAPISITLGDINRDGLIDLFTSTYLHKEIMQGQTIFNDVEYGSVSRLFLNKGDLKFEDLTTSSGLEYVHNTFVAVFIDVDEDGWLDLVVAHDTGEVRTYRNNGGLTFEMISNPMTGSFGYPMGVAVGDYNNDGRVDFFFSNTGSTMPEFMLRGDLRKDQNFMGEWLLFRNEGEFNFTEVGAQTHLAKFEFSWGALFEDFNLDGLQDLVVAENYVDLPNFKLVKLPCRFLLNTPSRRFIATGKESGVENYNYAISPLTADFNDDGYPDLVYANINGPSRVFINEGGKNNYIKVKLEQTPAALGAKVTVQVNRNLKLSDWHITGEGLSSDQSHTLVFGLSQHTAAQSILVEYPNGTTVELEDPKINKTYYIEKENQQLLKGTF